MKYDVIVIGAGNGGLVSALSLQQKGKQVLLLEAGNNPGGFASSFIRGRFEFDASLHELYEFGNEENHGKLYELFDQLGILDKISMQKLEESYHVVTLDTKEEYEMPTGIDAFIEKMEEYVPKSKNSMINFFELANEVHHALNFLIHTNRRITAEELIEEYPNFMKVATYSLEDVLHSLKMPKKAKDILTAYWVRFGSPIESLSFVHFASVMYSVIKNGVWIPKMRSQEISSVLASEFKRFGGTIRYLSKVTKMVFENDKICGVKTSDGKTFFADYFISNISPTSFYGNLIPKEKRTERMNELCNARTLGARGISVYLGLNKSPEELGLHHYSYFIYHSLNSSKEYNHMGQLYHDTSIGVVLNQALPDASEKGTTILTLTSFYPNDIFSKEVTEDNYYELKTKIAKRLIEAFESATKTNIQEAIEEIEIATPVTFARYGGHPDGSIYGYLAKGYDNLLPRILNESCENCFPNVRFCGGFAVNLSGYSATYLSGEMAAIKTLYRIKQDLMEAENENKDE